MRRFNPMPSRQRGYFLVLAVIFIMVVGVMGSTIANMFANRAQMSVAQHQGMQAFYVAESGLEIASRLLVGSSLVSGQGQTCASLTGYSLVTNATVLSGTFTATAVGGGLYSGSTTSSSGITATSNSLPLASTTGLAAHGRVRIGSEAIDYAAISGSSLIGLNRGVAGTTAASHSSGSSVSQSMCLVNVKAGIPSIAAPKYQRELEMAVEIITGTDMWAVGSRRGNNFTIIRWDAPTAGVWNDYSFSDNSNRENLNGVSFSTSTNGWAVGNERNNNFTFLAWNGTTWSVAPLAGACNNQDLNDVRIASTAEGWAVGQRYQPGCGGGQRRYTLMKWNGTSWSLLTPSSTPSIPSDANSNRNLNGVDILDANSDGFAEDGFAVGDNGTILRYNGTAWVDSPNSDNDDLYSVSILSSTEAWAVGEGGRILRWNGSTWSTVSSPTSRQLNDVKMVDTNGNGSANYGWASGDNGTIIYYNGSSWSSLSTPTNRDLEGVANVSATDAWAVGASDTIIQWDGTNWTSVSSPVSGNPRLNAITVVSGGGTATGSLVGSWLQIFH